MKQLDLLLDLNLEHHSLTLEQDHDHKQQTRARSPPT
uniref:Uncharacterized protein n=1 Tax=Picea glauca TaxID=3330 RepID=A0A101LVY5_PICGL|nr:hypothetical protein ABT39_MTgene1827 [Picea glauca]QHR91814.1 hypothetical protein Q903MT_gene5850 [Picea sitchensis]